MSLNLNLNFDNVYFLGDSLSDTGNFFNFTAGTFPNFPYEPGHLSNGDVWVDYFTDKSNITIDLFTGFDPSNAHDGVNFAIGGATSDSYNISGIVPLGLEQQVDALELLVANQSPGEVVDDDLFFLWIGPNDYFSFINDDPATPGIIEANFPKTKIEINKAVKEVVDTNIGGAIQDIIDAGGEDIVVFNLPDLDKTPLGQYLDEKDTEQLKKLTNKHNDRLLDVIEKIEESNSDVNIIHIDVHQLFNDILEDPGDFGFANVTDNYTGIDLYTGISQPPASGDPNKYLFWDSVHPTTRAHELIAASVIDQLTNEGLIM